MCVCNISNIPTTRIKWCNDLPQSICRNAMLWYLCLVMTTIVCMIVTYIFMDFMKGWLTYPTWLLFNYTAPTLFSLVFFHQTIAVVICGTINTACDGLVCGLLLHICSQLEILEYRLMQIPQKQCNLYDCVRHHDRIFELVAIKVFLWFSKICD